MEKSIKFKSRNRIMTLVKMQLADKTPFARGGTAAKRAIYIGLRFFALILLTAVYGGVFAFFNYIMSLRVDFNFLKFLICITQIISVIANISLLINNLYLSKDNVILFALPARHNEVFLSKLIVFYIGEFKKNTFLLLPAMLAYVVFGSVNLLYFVNGALMLIVLPFITVLAAALLSIPVMIIKNFLSYHPWVSLGFYLVVYGMIVYFIYELVRVFPDPFRMLALYKTYMEYVNNFIRSTNEYFILFGNAVNTMFSVRRWTDYVILAASAAGIAAGVYFLAMPLYFRIVCGVTDREIKKTHAAKEYKEETAFKAFCVKEVKTVTRNSRKLVSAFYSVLTFPLVMYTINGILAKMNTSDFGARLIVAFNIIIGVTLLAGSNALTATALSQEGAEFAILKTAPSKVYKIAWAKILLNLIASTLSIVIAFLVLMLVVHITLTDLILLFAVILLLNTAHVFWSFQYDMLEPNFADYALTGNLNNNKNVGRSIFTGILMAVGFGAVGAFLLFEDYTTGWIRLILLALAFLLLRTVLLLWNMRVYFKRIEM